MKKIIYTKTDEAPALATASLLPIIEAYTSTAGIEVETRDISLAGRIIAKFPEYLTQEQRISDDLAYLGELVNKKEANIIKLPNISASIPQLEAAIKELQEKGYNIPDYKEDVQTEEEKSIKERFDAIKGSAVNPVLREGNSDRRAPKAVKEYVKINPHRMGEWSKDSKTHVASMSKGDFYGSEQSALIEKDCTIDIKLLTDSGEEIILKKGLKLIEKEIIDSSILSVAELRKFLAEEIKDAKNQDLLFSLHLKATMMKVSDPIIFGHGVSVYFDSLIKEYEDELKSIDFNPNNGFGDLYAKIDKLPEAKAKEILASIEKIYSTQADLAMVNSDLGITNLHVPSDVIIDASMPAAIRSGGKMWNKDGQTQDMKAVIPDRSYAGVYQATIDFCKEHGAFDPRTMGSVANVGLMAQKAEEYGSHDKTFEVPANGKVIAIDNDGKILTEHIVEKGDIFRMCQVKDAPIQNWVKLAVDRARITNTPAVFWLDQNRAHDRALLAKVEEYLKDHDTNGLDLRFLSPEAATKLSLERIKEGKDTISVTGNVLRDYLTDLFPILELGTSAKMLSIVPLMNGGGLFETGAGGSAPKHVQQFQKENHLRWDSLGEFLALAESLEHLGRNFDLEKALILAETLSDAITTLLQKEKSPSRKVMEIDNRGSHFYLAFYWAEELASQSKDLAIKAIFENAVKLFQEHEEQIAQELIDVQGKETDLGGYYFPDPAKLSAATRPSKMFNEIIASVDRG